MFRNVHEIIRQPNRRAPQIITYCQGIPIWLPLRLPPLFHARSLLINGDFYHDVKDFNSCFSSAVKLGIFLVKYW